MIGQTCSLWQIMNEYSPKTNRLHMAPTPTAWTDIGSLFDICGILNNYSIEPFGEQADRVALRSDWLAVGDYIAEAIRIHRDALDGERRS